ncbi:MAG: LPS assembly lipoprotein LptE [Thermodesulfobacteriota bacterium]
MMTRLVLALFGVCLLAAGCGYRHPAATMAGGQHRAIRLPMWQNRSNELGLEATFQRALADWFRKAGWLVVTGSGDPAELELAGSIVKLWLPGRAYGAFDRAEELRAQVTCDVRLLTADGRTLWHEPALVMDEPATVGEDAVASRDHRNRALARLASNLAERLGFRVLATREAGP